MADGTFFQPTKSGRLKQGINRRKGLQINEHTNTWLVLEGDWGGQVYLTVPCQLLGDEPDVETLLAELDAACWPCNEGGGASCYLFNPFKRERWPEEKDEPALMAVTGGMGGGRLLEDAVWLHSEFDGTAEDMDILALGKTAETMDRIHSGYWTRRTRELLGMPPE